jgi:hypothetical protein
MMIDDPNYIPKRIAYIDAVRSLHKNKRMAGLVGCLLGLLLLAWAEFRSASPHWALVSGVAVIAVSWALFAYVIVARTRYVRAHPFDLES